MDLRLPRVLTAMVVGTGLAVAGAHVPGPAAQPARRPVRAGHGLGRGARGGDRGAHPGPRPGVPRVRAAPPARVRRRAGVGDRRLPAVADERAGADDLAAAHRATPSARCSPPGLAMAMYLSGHRPAPDLRVPAGRVRRRVVGAARRRRAADHRRQRSRSSLRARSLNGFLLGEEAAAHLGVDVRRERAILLALASLVTAAGVAVAGLIGFVGLVVPHVVRLLVGPERAARAARSRRCSARACSRPPTSSRGCWAGSRSASSPRSSARRSSCSCCAAPARGTSCERRGRSSADGVTVEVRGRAILRDVTLALAAGERVALVGPERRRQVDAPARVLAGTLKPTAGRVLLGGVPIADARAAARSPGASPSCPQQTALPFAMRVEEVVALGRLPHEDPLRGTRPADRAAIAAAIERVGARATCWVATRASSRSASGSSSCSRSPSRRTRRLMLLDEPTVHLDLRHQVEAMELLRRPQRARRHGDRRRPPRPRPRGALLPAAGRHRPRPDRRRRAAGGGPHRRPDPRRVRRRAGARPAAPRPRPAR